MSKWVQVDAKLWHDVVSGMGLKGRDEISSTYSVYDSEGEEAAWCAWWDGYGRAVREDVLANYQNMKPQPPA